MLATADHDASRALLRYGGYLTLQSYAGGQPLVVPGPERARTIAGSGGPKHDFKRHFRERARGSIRRFNPENLVRFTAIDPARFQDTPQD
jgi:hypothetical protein